MNVTTLKGKHDAHNVQLYSPSYCSWCSKTKHMLHENEIQYSYLDKDKASKDDKRQVILFLKEHKLPIAFPVVLIDEETLITGYKPETMMDALK